MVIFITKMNNMLKLSGIFIVEQYISINCNLKIWSFFFFFDCARLCLVASSETH